MTQDVPCRGTTSAVAGNVVLTFLPHVTLRRPISRISRATVHRATRKPSRLSCFQTLRAPYTR